MTSIVRWLALAGLAALAVATLATFLAGFLWLFDLFSHFRLQYIAVAVVLALLLLWTRPRWAAVAVLLLGVWHLYVYFDVPKARVADACASETVELLAFNLLYRNAHKEEAVAYIAESGADIVVLEENTEGWAPYLEMLAQTYFYRTPENWRSADGPTILSRFPLFDPRIVRPFEEAGLDASGARQDFAAGVRYLTVTARIADDDYMIVAVHPPYPNGAFLTGLRNEYLKSVAELARATDMPTIVAGDFNSTPWSTGFEPLFDIGGLSSAGVPLMTWPSSFPLAGIPIDHVLVNDGIMVAGAERGPDLGSDHFPIRATLCIPPSVADAS